MLITEKIQAEFRFSAFFPCYGGGSGVYGGFACRGLIMGILRKYGDGFAVLMTAAVFGLMHGNLTRCRSRLW